MTEQLNLLGLPATAAPPRTTHMTPAQREIVRLAARPEGVRPAEAGEIVHGARAGRAHPAFYGSDGWDALKRLRERGLVHQSQPRGPYRAGSSPIPGGTT